MGYDVHITRKSEWSDEAGSEISLQDWLNYIESDPEMRLDNYAETETSEGETLRIEEPGLAVRLAYSNHSLNGNMVWFAHFQDRITVKNPDKEILQKMYRTAQTLNANLQGDEGESYTADGNSNRDDGIFKAKKSWWKFWK